MTLTKYDIYGSILVVSGWKKGKGVRTIYDGSKQYIIYRRQLLRTSAIALELTAPNLPIYNNKYVCVCVCNQKLVDNYLCAGDICTRRQQARGQINSSVEANRVEAGETLEKNELLCTLHFFGI